MSGGDLRLAAPPAPGTEPVGWRCAWLENHVYAEPYIERPRPGRRDFATREEAVAWQSELSRDRYVSTVTAIYPRVVVSAKSAAASLDAAGWPIQHRPPR